MDGNGGLIMEINPRKLIGDNTKTTLSFQLAESDKAVHLDKFQLKVSLEKQEGGISSHLNYTDAENNLKKSKEIIEKLTHFTKSTSLDNTESSIQIDFKVIPDMEATELVYKIELMDEQGDLVDSTSLDWNIQHELILTQTTPRRIQGEDKNIKLKIHNPNADATDTGKLKLIVTRTEGSQATIVGTAPTIDEGVYELSLASLSGTQELNKILTIDSKTDLKASFNIQLYYQEKAQGNPVTVSWEQGMLLVLGIEAKGNPRILTYNIENKGTVSAKGVKLQYISKTDGAKLRGKPLVKDRIELIEIGDVVMDAKRIRQELGLLDFGTNSNVDIEFTLVYEGGQTNPQLYTFTPSDVQLSIDRLHYDPITGQVTYIIKNQGTDVAEKVQVKYTNISEGDKEEREVQLRTNKPGAITIAPNTSTDEQRLVLDFKKADKVTFKFEVFYNDKAINQATRIETFAAKEVIMNLIPVNIPSSNILLEGAKRMFEFKIEIPTGSRPIANIDFKHMWIEIVTKNNNDSFLSKPSTKEVKLNSLTRFDMDRIGKPIMLCVNPGTAKEAQFDLHLYYKNDPKGIPLHINWQEDKFQIKPDPNLFVGMNKASFKLCNHNTVAPIDPTQYTIELSTNKEGVQFSLINKDPVNIKPTSSKGAKKSTKGSKGIVVDTKSLEALIGPSQVDINKSTVPIHFELTEATDRIDEAQVTVTVKRDGIELASHSVKWEAEGVSLNVKEDNAKFEDKSNLMMHIENVGRAVPMDEIRVELVHDKGVCYKLGDVRGDNFSTSLCKILGKNASTSFEEKALKEMILTLEDKLPQERYTDNLTLKVYHKENPNPRITKEFTWINKQLFDQTFKALEQKVSSLRTEFDQFNRDAYLSLQNDDKDPMYLKWRDKAKEVTRYKQRSEDIQKEAIGLINKLNVKVQTEEKEKVETKIIQVAEEIKAEVGKYVLDVLGKILKQKVADVLKEAEERLHNVTKAAEFKHFVPSTVEVNETVAKEATQFFEDVISIRSKITQVSELLTHIRNLIVDMDMDGQVLKEQIDQAEAKCQLISNDLKALESTAIEILSAIATKFKDEVKSLIEEIGINFNQIGDLSGKISRYFDNEHTSFLKPIESEVKQNEVKQNIEDLFSGFSGTISASRTKAKLAYKFVNLVDNICMQAHYANVFKAHISSKQLETLQDISKDIKQMYESIQGLYSMSAKAAGTILAKVEQELRTMDQKIQIEKHTLEDMQEKLQGAAQICFFIAEFYRVNDNSSMEGKARKAADNFVDIMNQLHKKKQGYK